MKNLLFTLFIVVGVTIFQTKAHTQAHLRLPQNKAELAKFTKLLTTQPNTRIVFVTDLHDVVFKRLPGDYQRFVQLDWKAKAFFAWNGLRFGSHYIPHKLFGWPQHPAAEAYLLPDATNNNALKLISPFTPNMKMMKFYQQAPYPIFVCSNIGEHSYDYMKNLYEKRRKNHPEHAAWNSIIQGEQIATQANGYMQKDKVETFQVLVDTIENKLGYKPDIIIMVDDREKNIIKFKEAMKDQDITVIGYIFDNAKEFIADMGPIFNIEPEKTLKARALMPTAQNLTSYSHSTPLS